jgi:hypothetical protein
VDVAAAFHPLARHWHGGWVFPELSYPEFLGRLAQLLKRQARLGTVERLLFSPWLNPPAKLDEPVATVPPGGLRAGPAGEGKRTAANAGRASARQ